MSTESARANRCPRSQIPDLMALPPAEEHQVSGSDRIVGTHTPRSRRRFKALPIAIDAPQRPPHPRRAVRPGSPEMGKSTYPVRNPKKNGANHYVSDEDRTNCLPLARPG